MNPRKAMLCAVTLLCSAAISARAQNVLVTPGASSSSATVNVFGANPFVAANSITGPAGAFYAVADPAVTRYYLLSASGVSVVNATTRAAVATLATALPATAEAITPDGAKLLIASGNATGGAVDIYNLSGSTPVLEKSINLADGAFDVATSPDSARGYVATSTGISLVDLSSDTIGQPVTLSGLAPSDSARPLISIAPDSTLYVSANGSLYKLNPLDLSTLKTFSTSGYPGELSFTPDGSTAIARNQIAGSRTLTIFDLTGATAGNFLNFDVQMSRVVAADNTTGYAVSAQNGSLYIFPLASPSGLRPPTFPTLGQLASAKDLVLSNETPPKFLYVITLDKVFRVDLSAGENADPGQAALSGASGPAFYLTRALTASTGAATVTPFNANQVVAKGSATLPLALRVTDAAGSPLANQPVTWNSDTVTFHSKMTATNSDGIAVAYPTVPDTEATYLISASLGSSVRQDFSVEVSASAGGGNGGGGNGGGGGGGTTPPGVSILSGNGQAVGTANTAGGPLVVVVRDANGNLVSNATVTFAIAEGSDGTLAPAGTICSGTGTGKTITCPSNSNGLAGAIYMGAVVMPNQPFSQSTVTATATTQSNVSLGSVSFTMINIGSDAVIGFILPPNVSVTASPTITGQAGQTLADAIKYMVTSQNLLFAGTPIPNIGIEVRPGQKFDPTVTSPATCGTAAPLTNSQGAGVCNLVLGNTPGTFNLSAVVGGFFTFPFTLTIAPAPAVATTIQKTGSGDNQAGATGQTLPNPLSVVVKDQFGQPMSGVTVNFAVNSGAATLSAASATTNADGVASTTVTLGSTPGAVTVNASVGSVTPVTFNLTATAQLTGITKVAGDNNTAVINSTFPDLTVQVTSAQGPEQGVPVTFAVASGNATLSATSVVTGADGKASTTVTAGAQPGAIQVTATVSALPVQTFSLTQRLPGPVLSQASFVNGASFQPNITHGAIVAIVGDGVTTGISAGTCVASSVTAGPLPTRIAGIEVTFGGTPAPMFHVCRTSDGKDQVTVQVPFDLGVPSNTLAVVRTGAGTEAQQDTVVDGIPVLPSAPGIFEYTPTATSGRIAVAVRPDGSFVSPSNPALKGETIRLYTTGLGVSLPNAKTNQPGIPGQALFQTAAVSVGGQGASGVTAEYAQNMIGVFVVTFQVPSNPTVTNGVSSISVTIVDSGQTFNSQTSAIPIQ